MIVNDEQGPGELNLARVREHLKAFRKQLQEIPEAELTDDLLVVFVSGQVSWDASGAVVGKELADRPITVNCVTPAAVRTAMFEQMSRQQLFQIGYVAGMVAVPELRPFGDALAGGLGVLFLKYGRDAEHQADHCRDGT